MNLIRGIVVILLFSSLLYSEKYPARVKKSVTFIFSKDSSNRLEVQGTGFFVLLNANQENDTATFGYLVTTKTALKKQNGEFLETLYVRINRKEGYSDTLIVQLNVDSAPRYFIHPDSTVDLAIIPAFPDVNRYDVLYIPSGMIGAVDVFGRENIVEGSEVFSIGMLPSHIGLFKNIPAVRFGRIAQVSDEKYQWDKSFTELYLIETDITQGSTGSPVYYFNEALKDSGGIVRSRTLVLCGILVGDYGTGPHASGLARVIPSYKLFDLLNQSAVAGEREKELNRLRQKKNK
ncbi:MAG: hypothetical protein WCX28_02780 [Bacteriovoracaceae bacterium]|nr:hypothetical protein [Bacteroidota bacterium]